MPTKPTPETPMVFDGETNRPMNETELAQYAIDMQEHATRQAEHEAREATRQALLDRLGITADEARLLLG